MNPILVIAIGGVVFHHLGYESPLDHHAEASPIQLAIEQAPVQEAIQQPAHAPPVQAPAQQPMQQPAPQPVKLAQPIITDNQSSTRYCLMKPKHYLRTLLVLVLLGVLANSLSAQTYGLTTYNLENMKPVITEHLIPKEAIKDFNQQANWCEVYRDGKLLATIEENAALRKYCVYHMSMWVECCNSLSEAILFTIRRYDNATIRE